MGGGAAHRVDPAVERAAKFIHDLQQHRSEEPQVAEPMERLTARLIDLIGWLAVGLAVSICAFYIDLWFFEDRVRTVTRGDQTLTFLDTESLDPVVGWLSSVLAAAAVAVLEVLPTSRSGRNFSKRRLGLRVEAAGGGPPGLARAFARFAIWWIPAALALTWFGAEFGTWWGFLAMVSALAALAIPGWMFRSDSHRGLHDIVAGTRVVSDR